MENLVSLIIDLITALFNGSKNERPADSPPVNRPDPSRPRPQFRSTSWEDELRRLLDGQNPPTTTTPRQPPPVPPQLPRANPGVPSARPTAAIRPPAYAPRLSPEPVPSAIEVLAGKLAPLAQSQQAYARASQIDKTAAAQIERVPGQHVQMTTVVRRAASPEVMQVISLFKSAQAARQAVIASVVFGPPRALEEQTSANF